MSQLLITLFHIRVNKDDQLHHKVSRVSLAWRVNESRGLVIQKIKFSTVLTLHQILAIAFNHLNL